MMEAIKQNYDILSHLEKRPSIINIDSHLENGFHYYRFDEDTIVIEKCTDKNLLLFQIDGMTDIVCINVARITFSQGHLILVPKNSNVSFKVFKGCEVMSFVFDVPSANCNKIIFSELSAVCEDIHYIFQPLKIRDSLTYLFDYVIYSICHDLDFIDLYNSLENLMFAAFEGAYSKRELAFLFYPLVSKNPDFKDKILSNLPNIRCVNDMIKLMRMGRTRFFVLFKENFGITAKQYMQKLLDARLLRKAAEPQVTIRDLMNEFDFDSQSHFNHHVKKHFGCTPKELIERSRKNKADDDNLSPPRLIVV